LKVLVTGASGTIGQALCDALFARGDDVVGLTRDTGRAREDNPRVEWRKWESTLERPDPAAFEGVDGVVHLLGERIDQRWTEEAKERIMESRRQGTHNLVQTIAALQQPPKVLVSQSAVGIYGDRGEEKVDESDGPGTSFDSQVVQAWEAAAHELDRSEVRLVITRTGQVLSTSPGSTSTTRSGSSSGPLTTRTSAEPSTPAPRTRRPTRSSRRSSGGPSTAPQ
jgi:uncharacterized protein